MRAKIIAHPLEATKGKQKQTITPFLWFDRKAGEAAEFYASVFKNARVKTTARYSDEDAESMGMPKGSIMTVTFQIEGVDFTAINGGTAFKISPAISFMVNCRTREKIDELWAKLSEGGKALMELDQYPFSERYGWVEDKYGVSWQLILGNDSQIIAPCFMFTGEQRGKAEEAINYYMSVFKDSAVEMVEKYTAEEEGPTGALKYATFSLNGQNFKAMDSGIDVPFGFNPAVSFVVNCETQEEIDFHWEKLSAGGDELAQQCGWLKDRFGISWQILPEKLGLWISDTESTKGKRVMSELLQMKKLDMQVLQNAYYNTGEYDIDYSETGSHSERTDMSYLKRDTLTPKEKL